MQTRTLGRTGLNVSTIALGGLYTSDFGGGVEGTVATLERAFDLGINFIDTAPAYGNSEETLGKALAKTSNTPDPLILSTKLGGRPQPFDPQNAQQLRDSVDESLRLLGREHIDVLIIHEPDRPLQYNWWSDPVGVNGPVLEVLDELKAVGKIRFTGLGGTTTQPMHHLISTNKFDVLLTAFNFSALYREATHELLPTAIERGMGVIVGSSLQQGGLAKRYDGLKDAKPAWMSTARREQFLALYEFVDDTGLTLPEIGLRLTAHRPGVSTVLLGTSNPGHLAAGVDDIAKGPLPEDIERRLDLIAGMVPFRPFEEPMVLPMGKDYFGPGRANVGQGIQVGSL